MHHFWCNPCPLLGGRHLVSAAKPQIWRNSHIYAILPPMSESNFEWDKAKNLENQQKHGVSFYEAQYAFLDEHRVIAEDLAHSK